MHFGFYSFLKNWNNDIDIIVFFSLIFTPYKGLISLRLITSFNRILKLTNLKMFNKYKKVVPKSI